MKRVNLSGFVAPKDMPDWRKLLATDQPLWDRSLEAAEDGPRVLIATNVGGHGAVGVMESMLAVALTLRGARTTTLLCDGELPGCLKAEHSDVPDPMTLVDRKLKDSLCKGCIWRGESMVAPLGTGHEVYSQNLTSEEREIARSIAETTPYADIPSFHYEGLSVGEHAAAGAMRYFAKGDLSSEPHGEAVLRRYLEASMLSVFVTRRVIETNKIQIAVFHHGLYVPQGVVGEVCRKMGVRVVNWFVSYRRNTFIFSHDDTYHHTLMSEPTSQWEDMQWGADQERSIRDYLKSRWYGSRDWIAFHEKPQEPEKDFIAFAEKSGLDLTKPIIGMLTNVVWDAQLHYPANAFPNMVDWVLSTIRYFKTRPDLQLLLRIHPAEVRGTSPSRQRVLDEIRRAFPEVPANVFIIEPESAISTYAAMEHCDSVIIYGTKTGVELTSVGIPTIVAGEAWIRNKGVTLDAGSRAEYEQILDRLPVRERLTPEVMARARRYAFHFFFRRMIPLEFLQPNGKSSLYEINIGALDEFGPGRSRGLDVICDGVLKGTPFVFKAEEWGVHDA